MDTQEIIRAATPLIVPLVVAAIKWLQDRLPKWALPLLAGGLGAALDAVTAYVTGGPINPVAGVALGLAGVGIREAVDQVRKATQ